MFQPDIVDCTVNRMAEEVMRNVGLNPDIIALGKVFAEIGIDGFVEKLKRPGPGETKYDAKLLHMLKMAITAYEMAEVFKKHPRKQEAFLKILDAISGYQKVQIELQREQEGPSPSQETVQ